MRKITELKIIYQMNIQSSVIMAIPFGKACNLEVHKFGSY